MDPMRSNVEPDVPHFKRNTININRRIASFFLNDSSTSTKATHVDTQCRMKNLVKCIHWLCCFENLVVNASPLQNILSMRSSVKANEMENLPVSVWVNVQEHKHWIIWLKSSWHFLPLSRLRLNLHVYFDKIKFWGQSVIPSAGIRKATQSQTKLQHRNERQAAWCVGKYLPFVIFRINFLHEARRATGALWKSDKDDTQNLGIASMQYALTHTHTWNVNNEEKKNCHHEKLTCKRPGCV